MKNTEHTVVCQRVVIKVAIGRDVANILVFYWMLKFNC